VRRSSPGTWRRHGGCSLRPRPLARGTCRPFPGSTTATGGLNSGAVQQQTRCRRAALPVLNQQLPASVSDHRLVPFWLISVETDRDLLVNELGEYLTSNADHLRGAPNAASANLAHQAEAIPIGNPTRTSTTKCCLMRTQDAESATAQPNTTAPIRAPFGRRTVTSPAPAA